MDMQVRPEVEDLVRYETASAPNTFVEHAVGLLQAHQAWLTEHRAEVSPDASQTPSPLDTRY
jgi:hypothetical protein